VRGFVETLDTERLGERMKMETELLGEYKRLRGRQQELRAQRQRLLAVNTQIQQQIQVMRTKNREEEEGLRRIQAQSKQALEMKMKKADKASMIRDLMRFGSEKDQIQRLMEERTAKEAKMNRARD